jgi:hypothetical protein
MNSFRIVKSANGLRQLVSSADLTTERFYAKIIKKGEVLILNRPLLSLAESKRVGLGHPTQLEEIGLPAPKDSAVWWKRFWDDTAIVRYISTVTLIDDICIVSRKGTWRTLPWQYAGVDKSCFTLVKSEKELMRRLGHAVYKEMMFEVACCGISTRKLRNSKRDLNFERFWNANKSSFSRGAKS